MSIFKTLPVLAVATLLSACGSDSSNDSTQYAKVSFSVSDAPVDTMSEVMVAFDKIELQHENGNRYIIEVDEDDDGYGYQGIDLLDYQGKDSALIVTDEEIPVGQYKSMILHILSDESASYSWVVESGGGKENLGVPSSKLKLGGFDVSTQAVQSFTLEFDLRQALVERGGSGKGYHLKPNGVKIVDNDAASSLWGSVDLNLYDGDLCLINDGFVYLYQNHGLWGKQLSDNADSEYLPDGYVAPYSSAPVVWNDETNQLEYGFGFIPAGEYTAAFTCNAADDHPETFDNIQIANPEEQREEVILYQTKETRFDFKI
ncbi:DUF4382 domain-containing protein [Photobacterium sp. DNB23_23_1]|uniref:DUF4382 domain-containing protein n=1 Tax=Photobacterium pectinilyticum TaxID=2906793 RepID=A0ABT1N884_9GAMM|nr:DUF4382 domain-containing protein [Photobacterium sp. ZSDE20]MCQ1060951.1 DUF4382 domain-containing protein [Photobacterium sp. ZSDE20]MDD1828887.1 DUF4382 domain-containing protein [Photobacterium sp. ZSDE20]